MVRLGSATFREEARKLGRITEEDARAVDELGTRSRMFKRPCPTRRQPLPQRSRHRLNDLGQSLIPVASWLVRRLAWSRPSLPGFGKAVSEVYTTCRPRWNC